MPTAHRAHAQWSPRRLIQWGESIGASAGAIVEHLLRSKPHPEQAYRTSLGLLALARQYTEPRFESPTAIFRTITPKRWELLAKLQRTGLLGIRGLAREPDRDCRRVHDDVTALLQTGLIEKTDDGKIWVPFKDIRTNFDMHSAAA